MAEDPSEAAKGRFPKEVVEEMEGMGPDAMGCEKLRRLLSGRGMPGRYVNPSGPYSGYGLGHVFRLVMCCVL